MKSKKILLIISLLLFSFLSKSQPCITVASYCESSGGYTYCGPYELSAGIYRIPYVDGTEIEVTNDHLSHCPRGRVDMVGTDGDVNGEYHIAAAADGWIRAIVDNHNVQCDCSQSTCSNNYVWMEHPNGEWTKYTHFKQHSVTNLNHYEGEWVIAGTYLGNEGDVGCASGQHCHFEVAQPIDTNTLIFSEDGGYIDAAAAAGLAKNMIPVICGITGNVFKNGEEYVAGDCPSGCGGFIVPFPETISIGEYDVVLNEDDISNSLDFTIEGYGTGLFQAGSSITLSEGFESLINSTFVARIGDCDETPLKQGEQFQESDDELLTAYGDLKLFPNPAGNQLNVELNLQPDVSYIMTVLDVAGRILIQSANQSSETGVVSQSFSVSSFAEGIYFVEVQQSGKNYRGKFIVQH